VKDGAEIRNESVSSFDAVTNLPTNSMHNKIRDFKRRLPCRLGHKTKFYMNWLTIEREPEVYELFLDK